jgi:hypothetical protein
MRMVELPGGEVAAGQPELLVAAVRLDGDGLLVWMDGRDGAAGAVEDPGAVVVAPSDDCAADSEAPAGDLELLTAGLTPRSR